MLCLKCTAQVQKAVGLRKDQLGAPLVSTCPLGHWYVHRFAIGQTRFFLFMSEVSLLSFVLYQDRMQVDAQTLPSLFMAGLYRLLDMKGMQEADIHRTLECYHVGVFGKTDSRRTLGCMNDLVFCYTDAVLAQGGLDACDLTGIIARMNDMPQRTLDWASSWEVTQALVGGEQAVWH